MAPTSDEAREHNQNLLGGGGVFVHVNLAVYHYSANNPLRYVDPTGLSNEEADLIQQAVAYLVEQANAYADSLREEASASGRASLSLDLSTTIGGVKVKGSVALVGEYDSQEGFKVTGVAGLDIGAGTPGEELLDTGASATVGLRVVFGSFEKNDEGVGGIGNFGLLNVSLAGSARAQMFGQSINFEYRKQIVNFDTPTGQADFTLFNANTSKMGFARRQSLSGPFSITGGGRLNDF